MHSHLLGVGELLDAHGTLQQSGYAYSQVKSYDRAAIKASKLRIKEWDYYYFGDSKFAVALTVADNSYMSLASVSLIDFEHIRYITKSKIGLLSRGKLNMPSTCSCGDVRIAKGGVKIEFTIDETGQRKLNAEFPKFDGKTNFKCEIELDPTTGDNITVAIPFKKRKQFYYNTKINCLCGKGWFEVGDERYTFDNGIGGLDWGRGVWPYKNKWYWSSLSCVLDDGTPFGLNLGYGFGMPTASENVIFYNGKANKLRNVTFDIPFTLEKPDYLKPWKIADDSGRLDITFFPMVDRKDKMHALCLMTDQHQVFGKFYGNVTLDDGRVIAVTNKIGFAEYVRNKW
ncbi:MAG: DUF2804 domain-containing protein [Clostridiales bacterium]|nr:DUF2804 domain-containing protein [Clostridiales bacterium]